LEELENGSVGKILFQVCLEDEKLSCFLGDQYTSSTITAEPMTSKGGEVSSILLVIFIIIIIICLLSPW